MKPIMGATVTQRKTSLAKAIAAQLSSEGHEATLVTNRKNSRGHTDRVVIESSLGLVHVTALSRDNPNAEIPYQDSNKDKWLADKDYFAIGWEAKSRDRTLVFFLKPEHICGKSNLTRTDIKLLSENHLNIVIPH